MKHVFVAQMFLERGVHRHIIVGGQGRQIGVERHKTLVFTLRSLGTMP